MRLNNKLLSKSKRQYRLKKTTVLVLLVGIVGIIVVLLISRGFVNDTLPSEGAIEKDVDIDFSPIIKNWAEGVGGEKSVIIYDFKFNKIVGSYNPDRQYNMASLYKLFVVYEGYHRVNTREWALDDIILNGRYTIEKCLDLAIRESNSPCAEALWNKIGQAELDEIANSDFNTIGTTISGITSTASDILEMLKIYYHHDSIGEILWEKLADSMLIQPTTTYDWRRGLPSGFSEAVKIYNKVGFLSNDGIRWDLYHDASIIEFSDYNRYYAVVVLTENVGPEDIARLGAMIEKYVVKNIDSVH